MFETMSRPGVRNSRISTDKAVMPCTLAWPEHPSGVVLFAHDSGSGQLCPRIRYLATRLHHEGLATLQVDLLTPRESGNPAKAFDVALLARRIRAAARWLGRQPELQGLPIGVCGIGTGGAAAMIAAAEMPLELTALVTLGGQTDLAECAWPTVSTPTLMITGDRDLESLVFNREAKVQLTCPAHLVEIRGATRGLDEPGALEHAAGCATEWFIHYLVNKPAWHATVGPHNASHIA